MATFVNDTFTVGSNINLESHVGETGATWTLHPSYISKLQVAASTGSVAVQGSSTGSTAYYTSGTPASNEYDVECTVTRLGSSTDSLYPGICGRMSTTVDTHYMARYSFLNSRWELFRAVSGVGYTLLGSYPQTLTIGQDYTLRLELTSTAVNVYVDGVLRIPGSGETSITDAGRAGMRWTLSTANQFDGRIDNFSATDIGAASGRIMGPLAGNGGLAGMGGLAGRGGGLAG